MPLMNSNHNYSFRNRDFREPEKLSPTPNAAEAAACFIDSDWEIILPPSNSRLVKYFSHDLFSFLSDSFGICPRVRFTDRYADETDNPYHKIILISENDGTRFSVESDMPGAFHITVTEDSVLIVGKSDRGTAQGVYYIEDYMRLRGEAALKEENAEHAPLFSPRMTHSGYELDTFSDSFMQACAHAGMDAIIVFSGCHNTSFHGFPDDGALWEGTGKGYCDFNNLVWRAEGYGLDVYIYSSFICDVHPDEPNAREYYEKSFGMLFKKCPGLKGIIFVGECFEFPSKDPHTCGVRFQLKPKEETRRTPGWYPCEDYPALLTMVKDVINQYTPDADIVFWTYNWGWAPKEARLKLIENLPRDISLLVTFEMWEQLKDDLGMEYRIADYSLAFVGPSQVFIDEGEKAKELGIRLYAMGNSGARTWDNGSAPYIPAPQRWQKRYEALCRAKELYGVCGLMENHHYGWMPSFLDLLSKNAFTSGTVPNTEMLTAIAKRDFGEEYLQVLGAWECFSTAITKLIPCDIDQYGPYRCGPTYPLIFSQKRSEINIPFVPWAWHKAGGIWNPIYQDTVFGNVDNSLMRLRHVREVVKHFSEGVEILDSVVKKMGAAYGSEPSSQLAVARYMLCSYVTAENVMRWNIAKQLLFALAEKRAHERTADLLAALSLSEYSLKELSQYMREVAEKETENVTVALSCWQEDSRIGFEASMEYAFNDEFADWKCRETELSLKLLDDYVKAHS